MLQLVVTFLMLALISAFVGFGGIATYSYEGAKILFFIFLLLALLTYLAGMFRKPTV
jgi:uncharacterized membrane protein YtjA (UPF0391 family)